MPLHPCAGSRSVNRFEQETARAARGRAAIVSLALVLILVYPVYGGPIVPFGDPLDDTSVGKKTDIVKDQLKEKTVDGKTVYEQTVEIKNKTDAEITVTVTSHPWTTSGKFKKDAEGGFTPDDRRRLVPADPVKGKFGARQEAKDIKIPAGETKTVTFTWDEKFKLRYTDVYVDEKLDSGTSSRFDVASLSPFSPTMIAEGASGTFALDQLFPYPRAVYEDLFQGAAASFFIEPDFAVLPVGWSVDFLWPEVGKLFTFDMYAEPVTLLVQLNVPAAALRGQSAFLSYYVVQPDLDYRYHIYTTAVVVPEPGIALLLAISLIVLAVHRLRESQTSCEKRYRMPR